MANSWKKIETVISLKEGDLIQHAGDSGAVFIVTANYGSRVTAVKTVDVTNPKEWLKLEKD